MSLLSIYLAGINHRSAPFEIRERLALDKDSCDKLLSILQKDNNIQEAVVLSTCNRTELYVVGDRAGGLSNGNLSASIMHFAGLTDRYIEKYFYQAKDIHAAKHLFKVTSGLDSLVLGENQIIGQVRSAYSMSVEKSLIGTIFHKLFHQAFRVGKRSRSETTINAGSASVASVAVDLAGNIFSDFEGKNVLIIGAGEMARATMMNLKKAGVHHLWIANRTLSKAQEVADKFNACAIPLNALSERIRHSDLVICSTGANEPIIKTDTIQNIMTKREKNPLCLIDIAMPRNIEKSVNDLAGVCLYDLDSLKDIVGRNIKSRETEICKVEAIIEKELDNFTAWFNKFDVLPTIKHLQLHFEEIRTQLIIRNRKYFAEENWEQIDKFSRSLLKKVLHSPMMRLNQCRNVSELCGRCTIKEVFGLDDKHEKDNHWNTWKLSRPETDAPCEKCFAAAKSEA